MTTIDPRSISASARPSDRGERILGEINRTVTTEQSHIRMGDARQIAEYEATEAAGGMFRMALLSGNKDEAEAAWRDGLEELATMRLADTPWREVPLACIGLTPKTQNLLEESYGALLVKDLDGLTWETLWQWPNAGPETWREIVRCLRDGKRRHKLARESHAG